jgi:hypothetical protein
MLRCRGPGVNADLLLAHHCAEMEFGARLYAEANELRSGQVEQLRRVRQGFRGDAPGRYHPTPGPLQRLRYSDRYSDPAMPARDRCSCICPPFVAVTHVRSGLPKHRSRQFVGRGSAKSIPSPPGDLAGSRIGVAPVRPDRQYTRNFAKVKERGVRALVQRKHFLSVRIESTKSDGCVVSRPLL